MGASACDAPAKLVESLAGGAWVRRGLRVFLRESALGVDTERGLVAFDGPEQVRAPVTGR